MNLRVLGCHGGELPGCRSTCFLVDGALALDAGALTASLELPALAGVDHIVCRLVRWWKLEGEEQRLAFAVRRGDVNVQRFRSRG